MHLMNRYRGGRVVRGGLVAIGSLFLLSACAHVKPEEMEAELNRVQAELQDEIREGDRAVEERLGNRIDGVEGRLAGLENDLEELRRDYNVTVERLESAIRFNTPVHFAFDDATVRAEDRELLDRFADVVQGYYDGATITVEGFTDSAGSPAYNRQLGERRAEAVKEYLVNQGLAADQLRTVSYGEDQNRQLVPGAYGPGSDGWQNRRVAMVIDFGPDSSPQRQIAREDGSR
jgi:peptidoglycan-associated lipoprotein